MRVFEPQPAEKYEWCDALTQEDRVALYGLDGVPRGKSWVPISVRMIPSHGANDLVWADTPWQNGTALVFRGSAVQVLGAMLLRCGELLSLRAQDGGELFVFNCRVIDALDQERSKLMVLKKAGVVLRIEKPVFTRKCEGLDLFRVALKASPTYVSERFVSAYEAAGLKGMKFKEVSDG